MISLPPLSPVLVLLFLLALALAGCMKGGDVPAGSGDGSGDGTVADVDPPSGDPIGDADNPRTIEGTFRVFYATHRTDITFRSDGTCTAVSLTPEDRLEEACTFDLREGWVRSGEQEHELHFVSEDLLWITHPDWALRRVLEDGTVVGYPRVVDLDFYRTTQGASTGFDEMNLRQDGSITHHWRIDGEGMSYNGEYDLWEGFVLWASGNWATAFLLERQGKLSLILADKEYEQG